MFVPLLLLIAMDYTTYLGGSGPDVAAGIAVDYAGALYVAGTSSSTNFPVTSTSLGGPAAGRHCGFVTKFTPDGSGLELSVCIPDLTINAFAMDPSGAMYLAVTNLDSSQSLVKLDRNAQTLIYTVPLGNVYISGIATDPYGAVYVTGSSTALTTTAGAYQSALAPGVCYGGNGPGGPCSDAFVLKISRYGAIVYATYLGGSAPDSAAAIAIDSYGDAWITGMTVSPNFPTTPNALQKAFHGEIDLGPERFGDAFVAELDPTGSTLLYSSYLGGAEVDYGSAIAVDAVGSVYVAGFTQSPDFPVTAGPAFSGNPIAIPGSQGNGFVTKLDANANMIYSEYMANPVAGIAVNSERQACAAGSFIAVNNDSEIYTAGTTRQYLTSIASAGAFQTTYGGGDSDAFAQASAASLCFQAPLR